MNEQWRALSYTHSVEELPKGLDKLWQTASCTVKSWRKPHFRYMRAAKKIIKLSPKYEKMTDAELKEAMIPYQEKALRLQLKDKHLNEAFALIREASFRVLGMRHYAVQLAGGLAICDGTIAEMATGEGKTLTASLPGIAIGWARRGCHIMTSNSYLAKRDAEEIKPLYEFCDISVGHIEESYENDDKRKAYNSDVTYCTNKDVAADFLRDQIALGKQKTLADNLLQKIHGGQEPTYSETVLRGLEFAVVDEADSVMIDDAVTPLLISGDAGLSPNADMYIEAGRIADTLKETQDYILKRKFRDVELTDSCKEELKKTCEAKGGIWKNTNRREELIMQALEARFYFLKNKQYIIKEDKIVIVDESTGRLMEDRFWRNGTHQAVEAKEKVTVTSGKDTFARISFQKFFRFYRQVSGMTGTAQEAKQEFWRIYQLPITVIPRNRKNVCKYQWNRIFHNSDNRWKAVVKSIQDIHAQGRPILIGTSSIESSKHLHDLLEAAEVEHVVLNALEHEGEAEIVANAGKKGAITVATNMAGRGTDIKLTQEVQDLGGLHVIGTEKFISKRIDRQLYGRCARQGNPGSVQCFLSVDDELLKINIPWLVKFTKVAFPFLPFKSLLYSRAQKVSMAQSKDQRERILESDTYLESSLGFSGREY